MDITQGILECAVGSSQVLLEVFSFRSSLAGVDQLEFEDAGANNPRGRIEEVKLAIKAEK